VSGNYGFDLVCAICMADKGIGKSIAVERAQADQRLLVHSGARLTGSVALIFALALAEERRRKSREVEAEIS
jgi:hypothetical protein